MANITMKFDVETAKAVQGFLKIEDRQKALESKSKQLAQSTGRQQKGAVRGNQDWAKSLATIAASYIGATAAVGLMTKALRSMHEERERAAQSAIQNRMGMGSLAQLTDDPKRLKQLRGMVEMVRGRGVPLEPAAGLTFAAVSAGKEQHLPFYASMYGMADPEMMLARATEMQNAYGIKETGPQPRLVSKAFVASGRSLTRVGPLMGAAASVGPGMRLIGGTDEEALAILAVLSRQMSPEDAATKHNAINRVIAKHPELEAGKGTMHGVAQIAAMNLSEKELFTWVGGRALAVEAYLALNAQRGEVEKVRGKLEEEDREAEAGRGSVGRRISAYQGEFGPAMRYAGAKEAHDIAREKALSKEQIERNIIIEQAMTQSLERGESGVGRLLRGSTLRLLSTLNHPPEVLEGLETADRWLRTATGIQPDVENQVPGLDIEVTVKDKRDPGANRMRGVE